MRYRSLGSSGLKVSELCLGTMMFGGPTPEPDAQRIADHAADAGVNFIDSANVYEKGRSEEVVGRVVKSKRDHWVLGAGARHLLDRQGSARAHIEFRAAHPPSFPGRALQQPR